MSLRLRFRTMRGRPAPEPPVPGIVGAAGSGGWNPADIDLMHDALDWPELSEAERDFLLRLTALGQAGDVGARGRLPLIMAAEEQCLEEELHLTSFLWEEAKHAEIFRRFFAEIAPGIDVARYRTEGQRQIVQVDLIETLQRLESDNSPLAQAEASVTYNLIVVGVLTDTGYRGCRSALARHGVLPGMQQAVAFLEEDTTRHLEHSVRLLAKLAAEHGASVRDAVALRASNLRGPALCALEAVFAADPEPPFGLVAGEFITPAMARFDEQVRTITM